MNSFPITIIFACHNKRAMKRFMVTSSYKTYLCQNYIQHISKTRQSQRKIHQLSIMTTFEWKNNELYIMWRTPHLLPTILVDIELINF